MTDTEVFEGFERAVRFKRYSFASFMLSVVPMAFLQDGLRIVLFLIFFVAGVYLDMQFKCPACGAKFDTRIDSGTLKYCSSCARRL